MKLFSTLTLSLFAMNAMALPVLHELDPGQSIRIFKDHEDPKKVYFMPDSVELRGLEEKRPEFLIFETGDNELSVNVETKFRPVISKSLQRRLDFEKSKGNQVSVLQAAQIELERTMFEGSFNGYEVSRCTDDLDSNFSFIVHGRRESVVDLVTQIKQSKEKVSMGKVCHLVSGMTPTMSAMVSLNEAKVLGHLMSKFTNSNHTDDEDEEEILISELDVRQAIKELILDGQVRVVILGGEAKIGDYIYEITNRILEKYFHSAFEDYKFERNTVEPSDMVLEMTLEGQAEVTKPFCQDLDITPIKDYPELLKF